MAWINELTDQEIMKLTDDDVIAMVRRKCAEEGVKILQQPEEPTPFQIQPELTFFVVAGHYFENAADAEATVLTLVKSYEEAYDYAVGYSHKYPKKIESRSIEIETKRLFSKKQLDTFKDELTAHKEAESRYSELQSEWKEAQGHRNEFADEIWDKVREVRAKYDKLNNMRQQYADYVKIANGDEQLAWQFFVKAYQEQNDQDKAYIINKIP